MKQYLIDGNNLIGKIPFLSSLQKKDKQAVREKLVYILNNYFRTKKVIVFLHFDGYQNIPIKTEKIKIIYSDNKTADEKVRAQIEKEKNSANLVIVSSDTGITNFAKVCGSAVISSEEFGKLLLTTSAKEAEKPNITSKEEIDEFKKLFGG